MADKKPFPKHRILSSKQLTNHIIESNNNNIRFCFILGSGASVSSGIPMGKVLEKIWMDCLMGTKNDNPGLEFTPETTRELAEHLSEEGLLEHSFSDIKAAWEKGQLPSEYYFDIYKLRFYPDHTNGYRYLEQIMENKEPSIGYYILSLLATEKNLNNLIITTNFDSLMEDALFLLSQKRPLVVSHESLANYISMEVQRPIIAKVHRGLFYEPFNSPETTNSLSDQWRTALNHIFEIYTPIVIGYGGGDGSLMSFLCEESTRMRHGVYWCYKGNLPDERIQNLVRQKEGYFVETDGFDALMLEIGKVLFKEKINPENIEKLLTQQTQERITKYADQWTKEKIDPKSKEIIEEIDQDSIEEEKKREEAGELTFWDHVRRAKRAKTDGNYDVALDEWTTAIQIKPDNAMTYNGRGFTYASKGQYKDAIRDLTKAIELDPNNPEAYNNRGYAYDNLQQYDKAIEDYTKAIDLDSYNPVVYCNRGCAYRFLQQYDKAIEDCSKAIELNPNDAGAYYNRGNAYDCLQQYDKAIEDYSIVIELNPNNATSYCSRGDAYDSLQQYRKAIKDYTKAIKLKPYYALPYINRGYTYINLQQYETAIKDFNKAIELDPNDATSYNNRGCAYDSLQQYDKAIEDFTKAIELDPHDTETYRLRGLTYKNIWKNKESLNDLNKAIELDPSSPESFEERATIYKILDKNDLAKADKRWAKALKKKHR